MPYLLDIDDPDIPPQKHDEYLRILRAIPPGRRMEAVCQLNDLQRDVLASGVRALYPGISDREVAAKLSWLWFPDDLWEKVYGSKSQETKKEQ